MRRGEPHPETFADIIGRYLGKPYSPNGHGPSSYGCFGLIYAYAKNRGAWVPSECWTLRGRWTIANYADLFEDIEYAEEVMGAVFESMGIPIYSLHKLAGDILIVKHPNTGRFFPAIYTGNGHAIASFLGKQVRTFSLGKECEVVVVRRIV
jgi:hypothetical protein